MKLLLEKIKIIKNPKGDIFKLLSKQSKLFEKFGELYISEVKPNKFKGWKYNEKFIQLLTVVKGTVEFKIRKKSQVKTITISYPKKLSLLKVPPKTYYCFRNKNKNKSTAFVLNVTDQVYR